MPNYMYRATDSTGQVCKGYIHLETENDLAVHLRNKKLELISAKIPTSFNTSSFISRNKKTTDLELIVFFRHIRDFLNVGYDIREALSLSTLALKNNSLKKNLPSILKKIDEGASLSTAFSFAPQFFDPILLALLKTGEMTGNLNESFERIILRLNNAYQFQKKIRKSLRYPLFLLFLAFLTSGFMVTYVVPEVIIFLKNVSSTLPQSTRILIAVSDYVASFFWISTGGVVFSFLLGSWLRKTSKYFLHFTDSALLNIPIIGEIKKKFALSRYATSLSSLLQSGHDIPSSLPLAIATLHNTYLERLFHSAGEKINSGTSLSSSLSDLFPEQISKMLEVSEKSGQLTKILSESGRIMSDEASETTDQLISSIEPLLTCIIGGMLAWIVLAVLGPIYGSLDTLSTGL